MRAKTGYDDFFKKARAAREPGVEALRTRVREKQRLRRKKPFPARLVFTSLIGAALAGVGLIYHERLDALIGSLEFHWSTPAIAADAKDSKKAPATGGADEAASQAANQKQALQKEASANAVPVDKNEMDHLRKLVDRKKQLDLREEELNRLEAELQKQKAELDARLKQLEDTRASISTVLQERSVKDEEKVETLVQMYSNMKPAQAAKILESMDEDLAVEIVGRMKKKSAAEIMNLMKPEKAQVFSEKYAGYRKR